MTVRFRHARPPVCATGNSRSACGIAPGNINEEKRKVDKHLQDIQNLSWNKSAETQKNAMMNLVAATDWDCAQCIIDTEKDVWENLVAVIENKGYDEKKILLKDFLFLLQDLNWPGARRALEIIKSMEKADVQKPLQEALLEALSLNDEMWIFGLKIVADYFGYDGVGVLPQPRRDEPLRMNQRPLHFSARAFSSA